MFVTIASYHDPIEAHIACGRLRAEGIDAHVADDQIAVVNWEWRLAVGGIRLRVADTDLERARSVLSQLDAGVYSLEHRHEETEDQELALQLPARETLSSRIAWVALMLCAIPLPWRRRHNDDVVRKV